MKSKYYHDLLLNEYENKELSKEDLSSTLKHYANLYFKEKLKSKLKAQQEKLDIKDVSRSYLILSGEGNIDTENQFCAEFDNIDKCNAFFDRLKSEDFKDTYLYIYEAVKLREE